MKEILKPIDKKRAKETIGKISARSDTCQDGISALSPGENSAGLEALRVIGQGIDKNDLQKLNDFLDNR